MRYHRVTDEVVVEAVRSAHEEGDTDLLDGGVAPGTAADRLGIAKGTAQKRMADLTREGDLVRVDGLSPDGNPRKSYLPAEAYEPDPRFQPRGALKRSSKS